MFLFFKNFEKIQFVSKNKHSIDLSYLWRFRRSWSYSDKGLCTLFSLRLPYFVQIISEFKKLSD